MFVSVDFGLDSRSSCVIDFIKYHDNRQSTREIGKPKATSGNPVTAADWQRSAVFWQIQRATRRWSRFRAMPVKSRPREVRPGLGQESRPAAKHSGLHLKECRSAPPDSLFGSLIAKAAGDRGVEPRALIVRVLLELPRTASWGGRVSERQVTRLIQACADRLRDEARAAAIYVPVKAFPLSQLTFEATAEARAQPILTYLHYLRSARPGSRYFSLVDPEHGLPVALCSVSEFQWARVASQLFRQFLIPQLQILDVSRVFAVDSAPANSISTLLSRVRTWVRRNEPSVKLLTTAVDPNLGFTGASYRAANWKQWVTIKARPYLYERRLYVTPRQLRERYGTSRFDQLQAKFPGRFERSRSQLLDSIIYCCRVNGETETVPPEEMRQLNR